MALTGKINPSGRDGKKEFIATFTNGTVEQLNEIFNFLESEDINLPTTSDDEGEKLASVVRFGISWLERIKEQSKKSETK